MATKKITLTDEWQQITTGSESVFIQSRYGKVAICESQTRPADDYPSINIMEANICPPSVIWARACIPGTVLVIVEPGE